MIHEEQSSQYICARKNFPSSWATEAAIKTRQEELWWTHWRSTFLFHKIKHAIARPPYLAPWNPTLATQHTNTLKFVLVKSTKEQDMKNLQIELTKSIVGKAREIATVSNKRTRRASAPNFFISFICL